MAGTGPAMTSVCRARAPTHWPKRTCLSTVMPGHDVETHCLSSVMPGFMPGIHVLAALPRPKTWMAGTSPAMTPSVWRERTHCLSTVMPGHDVEMHCLSSVMPGFMPGIHVLLHEIKPCPTRHAVVRLLQFRIAPQPNIHF